MDRQRLHRQQLSPAQPEKGDEITLGDMHAMEIAAAAAETAAQIIAPSIIFAKEIGEINQKTNGLNEENEKLREKIKDLKRQNDALKQKIETMENQSHKQQETIRIMESSQDKLQKELEKVKTAKDRLRVEFEEKSSKFNAENKILAEKLETLTSEFEEVEKENKELKRRLEELANSNDSLTKTVDVIKEENQQLRKDMTKVKEENKKISEKLECKERRLALGQVAFMLEQEIWKIVLPDETMGTTAVFKSMERWLKRNSSKPEGKAAQKRWDELQSKLNWDEEDHKFGLKHLKQFRINDAHPSKVDLEVARKELNEGGYFSNQEKEICEEIINMVVIAKQLNKSN